MEQEESDALDRCADCGIEIARGMVDRCFAVSDDSVICFECAVRRGGSWDERHARWSTPPDVDDLLERERPT